MPADDHVHFVVEAIDDIQDRAGDADTAVDRAGAAWDAAFVDQHHDRLNAFLFQLGHQGIDRVGFVQEVQARRRRTAYTMLGVPSRVMPMKATLAPAKERILVRREDGLAVILADDIGGQVLEVRAGEIVAIQAAIHRMAAALLHAHQFCAAFIEFVVAHGIVVQADQVEGFDRRLVMEQALKAAGWRRSYRRRRLPPCSGLRCAQGVDMCGQVFHPAGIDRAHPPAGSGGRYKIAMKIVNRQDLNVHSAGRLGGD